MDQKMVSAGAKKLVTLAIESVFSVEPRELSLLHVLFYIHSASNLNYLVDTQAV